MVEGVWELMPTAEVWHIGLYRDERTLKPVEYYNKLPIEPTVSVCLVLDPMLATGGSATATVGILKRWGVRRIKIRWTSSEPQKEFGQCNQLILKYPYFLQQLMIT